MRTCARRRKSCFASGPSGRGSVVSSSHLPLYFRVASCWVNPLAGKKYLPRWLFLAWTFRKRRKKEVKGTRSPPRKGPVRRGPSPVGEIRFSTHRTPLSRKSYWRYGVTGCCPWTRARLFLLPGGAPVFSRASVAPGTALVPDHCRRHAARQ